MPAMTKLAIRQQIGNILQRTRGAGRNMARDIGGPEFLTALRQGTHGAAAPLGGGIMGGAAGAISGDDYSAARILGGAAAGAGAGYGNARLMRHLLTKAPQAQQAAQAAQVQARALRTGGAPGARLLGPARAHPTMPREAPTTILPSSGVTTHLPRHLEAQKALDAGLIWPRSLMAELQYSRKGMAVNPMSQVASKARNIGRQDAVKMLPEARIVKMLPEARILSGASPVPTSSHTLERLRQQGFQIA